MTRKYTFYFVDSAAHIIAYVTLYKDAMDEWHYSQYNSNTNSRISITRLSDSCPDEESWLRNTMAHARHVKDQYVNVVGNLCSVKDAYL
jgi:hypothetical protein